MHVVPKYFLIPLGKLRIYYDQNGGNCGKTRQELSFNETFFYDELKACPRSSFCFFTFC